MRFIVVFWQKYSAKNVRHWMENLRQIACPKWTNESQKERTYLAKETDKSRCIKRLTAIE